MRKKIIIRYTLWVKYKDSHPFSCQVDIILSITRPALAKLKEASAAGMIAEIVK